MRVWKSTKFNIQLSMLLASQVFAHKTKHCKNNNADLAMAVDEKLADSLSSKWDILCKSIQKNLYFFSFSSILCE